MSPREFLPPGAITNARIEALFADTLAAWGHDWFPHARAGLQLAGSGRSARPLPAEREAGEPLPEAMRHIDMAAIGRRRILEAALNIHLEGVQTSAADRRIMDRFTEQIAMDLAARLDMAPVDRAPSATRIDLSLDGHMVATLSVSGDALIRAIRQTLPTNPKAAIFPCGRAEAAGPVIVSLEAVLGSVDITLRDLAELASGDVIVLDRRTNDLSALRIKGSSDPVRWGHLTRDQEHNALTIAPATPGQT